MKRHVYTACAALVLWSMAHAADPPRPDGAAQIKSIPFHELAQTYATNEARAEALYEGKQITVTGTVARVITSRQPPHPEGKDAYLVELKAVQSGLTEVYIQFFFNKARRASLAELRAGQEVTIQGHGGRPGVYAGDRRTQKKDILEVPFHDCTIIKTK
jgi:tRNA_anti-like